jgi:PPE-repeat protein
MDFGAPPEITSALIHSGPGAGSLLAAANAWRQLATDLEQTAAQYASTVAGIPWTGPSATAMIASVQPYLAWMQATAGTAAQMSMAATTMASSFAATELAVVHPSVVAANRMQLAHLIATNLFGINAPAIAATEAQYVQMWAGNTAALLGYNATSLQTMTLQPFTPPPQTTNPAGVGTQAAVQAATPAQNSFFSNPFIQAVNGYLQNATGGLIQAPQTIGVAFAAGHDFQPGQFPGTLVPTSRNLAAGYGDISGLAVGFAPNPTGAGPGAGAGSGAAGAPIRGPITASFGQSVPLGGLSAPSSAVRLIAQTAPMATAIEGSMPMPVFIPPIPPGSRKPQRDKPGEGGYGPPIGGSVMPRGPSGG